MSDHEIVAFLTANGETHRKWADFMEANPEQEARYVATGDWDNAKEHRRLQAGYEFAVMRFKELMK